MTLKEGIWITQYDGTDDREIVKLVCSEGTYDQIRRMKIDKVELAPGRCLVELMDEKFLDILTDRPIVVDDFQGQWLMKVFFRQPERWWKRVKVNENAEE